MSEAIPNNQPTHILYSVSGDGDDAHWVKIGAAWSHKDNKGLNLSVDLMPTRPGRFVIRKAEPKKET